MVSTRGFYLLHQLSLDVSYFPVSASQIGGGNQGQSVAVSRTSERAAGWWQQNLFKFPPLCSKIPGSATGSKCIEFKTQIHVQSLPICPHSAKTYCFLVLDLEISVLRTVVVKALATVGGAALGAVFGALLDGVIAAVKKANLFKSQLRQLKSTLEAFEGVDEQVRQHENIKFGQMQGLDKFRKKMEKGAELVDKCSKVRRWKWTAFRKPAYASKLSALDASVKTLLNVLLMHISCDVRNRQIELANQINARIVAQNQNQNQIEGSCTVSEPPTFTVGLDAYLSELKMEILKEEASVLVLSGPGGWGKTTLAEKLCHLQEVKDKFKDNIFSVLVKGKSNCRVVQGLCEKMGSWVPAFEDEATAFTWLQKFLKIQGKCPLLLLLDDAGAGSETESLLQKLGEFKEPNFKVLVTSRVRFPSVRCNYQIDRLQHGDALILFRHSASGPDGSFPIPEHLAEKIVKLCMGIPLSIVAIGKSLCGRPIEIWEKKEAELSKGSSILDSGNDLLERLKHSLDTLDKGLAITKECFIDFGSFPEGQRIPATALIDIWTELHGLDQDSWSIANIHELTTRNLANLVTRNEKMELGGYYSEHFVTQHDVLRALAIREAGEDEKGQAKRLILDIRGDSIPEWWTKQKKKPKKTGLFSISTDGNSSEKWHNMNPPKCRVLVLNFQTEKYVLPKFVKKMSKLNVLIVTNYGVSHAELSNFQLLGSLSYLKRIRLERISLPSITKKSTQLKSLKKISLFMCSVGQAFSTSSIKISKAFPSLGEMNIDYCIDLVELLVGLCDLIHLKKLSITNCHKLIGLPEDIGKLANLEVLRLRSCTALERLPGSISSLDRLHYIDMYNCYSIGELPENFGQMSGLRKINMGQCSRLKELPQSVSELQHLEEVLCDEDTEYLWGPFLSSFQININVVKENINLNWLQNPCSSVVFGNGYL